MFSPSVDIDTVLQALGLLRWRMMVAADSAQHNANVQWTLSTYYTVQPCRNCLEKNIPLKEETQAV